jgi:AcrR family transcriptional regulator
MPRVSEEHLESRRRQILDAARTLFAANGFHATSMQDLLAECGLSAGAVYRYFPSKEDMIVAIAEEAMGSVRSVVAEDIDDLTLPEIVRRMVAAVDERADRDDLGRLALQVWAEAARSETLRTRLVAFVFETRELLRDRIAAAYGPGVDADATAAVVTSLLPAYCHAKVIAGDVDPERYLRGLDGLAAALTAGGATVASDT